MERFRDRKVKFGSEITQPEGRVLYLVLNCDVNLDAGDERLRLGRERTQIVKGLALDHLSGSSQL